MQAGIARTVYGELRTFALCLLCLREKRRRANKRMHAIREEGRLARFARQRQLLAALSAPFFHRFGEPFHDVLKRRPVLQQRLGSAF
jgi:hypothetical protein